MLPPPCGADKRLVGRHEQPPRRRVRVAFGGTAAGPVQQRLAGRPFGHGVYLGQRPPETGADKGAEEPAPGIAEHGEGHGLSIGHASLRMCAAPARRRAHIERGDGR